MMVLSIAGVFLGALVYVATAFQTVFSGEDNYYQSSADQMRVLDYIARDVRNAIGSGVNCGSVSNNGQTFTVYLPDYINPTTNLPRTPAVSPGALKSAINVSYFASVGDSVQVTYAVSGNTITRTQTAVRSGVTTTTSKIIANNVDSLQLTDATTSGNTVFTFGPASTCSGAVQFVKTTITFLPKYSRGTLATSRAGTTVSQTVDVRGN